MSQTSKIWLSSPHMGGTEQDYVNEAFNENWIAPLGPNVNAFEIQLEKYLNPNRPVASLSSGTAALHLALVQLGITQGDEVLCQSFTFSASANPIIYQGAQPIFIDSETKTWNMCPQALEEAIKDRIADYKKPKAIIAVHLYGMPYQVEEIHGIAEAYDIPVIEDAAEALGSKYRTKSCGTFGKFAALSFNGNKIITTSGGGALVCQTPTEKQETVKLATQSRDHAPHYQHSQLGYNYRMSNICAGIGRGQMEVLDQHIGLRRDMHDFYKELFKNIDGVKVFEEPNGDYFSNHWLSAIIINPEITGFTREDLRLHLLDHNIESRPLWKPMHLQPYFKECLYFGNKIAETLFDQGLCLPSGSNLTSVDRDRIATQITNFIKIV